MSGAGATLSPFALPEDHERLSRRRKLENPTERTAHEKRPRLEDEDDTNNKTLVSHAQSKRKSVSKTADTKQRFCELCQEYYPSLRAHLESSSHLRRAGPANKELEAIVAQFQNDIFKVRLELS